MHGPARSNSAIRPAGQDLTDENFPAQNGESEIAQAQVQDEDGLVVASKDGQKQFFEFAGALFGAKIQPSSALVKVGEAKTFCALGQDKSKRRVEESLVFTWEIIEGTGSLDKQEGEMVVFQAPAEPGIVRLKVTVKHVDIVCEAQATITVVAELIKIPKESAQAQSKGLPSYTLESAPGQLWRSRYDQKRNLVVVNAGHRDFIYAAAQNTRKLRYICRLFAKELILHNFIGMPSDQLLERLIELSLYTEENLK